MAAKNDTVNNCVIGENSVFEGRFLVSGSILIEGKFEGEIKTDEQLTVGATGKVKTDIVARRVSVAGTVIGNIAASEEVSLLGNAKVLGNITTPRLNIEEGVITHGLVTITSGKEEGVAQIIRESFGEDADKLLAGTERTPRRERQREPRAE
jgi:cytoskeletal protein CcmA (bactofilin family)